MTDSVSAVASLGNVASPLSGGPAAAAKTETDGQSFASALGDLVSSANTDLKRAEAMSISGIKGEAETHEVVTALMSAEESLRMAIAVRDKVVQAYLDLSRMQI